jgi:hypothetical protein
MSDFIYEQPIKQYPYVYAKMRDIQAVSAAQIEKYKELGKEVQRLDDDLFFQTASEQTTKRNEAIAEITAGENDTLEFRRMRVENRFNLSAPYTIRFLVEKFNEVIGMGNWSATISKSKTLLTLECSINNQQWFEEIIVTIKEIIPARMRFINKPFSQDTLCITDVTEGGILYRNYQLGVWQLGMKPIGTPDMKEIIGDDTMTLTESFLSKTTKEMLNDISKIRINGHIEITEIDIYQEGNEGYIEYLVNQELADAVEKVELFCRDGTMISTATIFVPLLNDLVMKHKFKIVEGED